MSTMQLLAVALALAAVASTGSEADLGAALGENDECAVGGEDGAACGLSALQLKAARTDENITENSGQEAWIQHFCSSECKAAGYCCNDASVGSNQVISCAQACVMRARGSSLASMLTTRDGLCKRNGASGCSLSVNGHRYSFCSTCTDLTSAAQCKWGVASSDACDYGARLAPTPEKYCSFACKSAGFCCNDFAVGSNQMISCAQACVMRVQGSSLQEMLTASGGLCKRNGGSGCSLWVKGHRYSFCSTCSDLTGAEKCNFGVASSDACDYGAAVAPGL